MTTADQEAEDDDWDKQIAADAESGKLDALFAADIQAFQDKHPQQQ
jgi:hypothetical protein